MKKDPAFLFYDGDAARDVSHMNRLERGCYFDLIQAQRKFRGYTVEQVRKILGKDFSSCWPSLELVLEKENKTFFIGWLRSSIDKREVFAEKQRKRIQDYWDSRDAKPLPRNNQTTTVDIPAENANAIEDEDAHGNEILNPKRVAINTRDKILRGDGVPVPEYESLPPEFKILIPLSILENDDGILFLKGDIKNG